MKIKYTLTQEVIPDQDEAVAHTKLTHEVFASHDIDVLKEDFKYFLLGCGFDSREVLKLFNANVEDKLPTLPPQESTVHPENDATIAHMKAMFKLLLNAADAAVSKPNEETFNNLKMAVLQIKK